MKRQRTNKQAETAELAEIDREVGKHLDPSCNGRDLRPSPDEDPFTKKLMGEERAFIHPEEWGIDVRPIILEQLKAPQSPEDLEDSEVSGYLRWIVLVLAQHHLCLTSTNHLSDRELYLYIMEEVLPQPIGVSSNPKGALVYHDCCSYESDVYMACYADDSFRRECREKYNEIVPDKRPFVSDRDLWLEMLAEAHRDQPLPDYDVEDAPAAT